MIAGILLAAGQSRRFGSDKRLYPWQGTPLVLHTASALRTACPDMVVVIGPDDDALRALLASEGIETVTCPGAAGGMGHSIGCGVRAKEAASGWIIALADMPFIHPTTILRVHEQLSQGASLVAPSYRGRQGHPVGFSASHRAALLRLTGDHGAKRLLESAAAEGSLQAFACDDPGVVRDLDEPADLGDIGDSVLR